MENYPLAFARSETAVVSSSMAEVGLHFLGLLTNYHKITWLETTEICFIVLEARIVKLGYQQGHALSKD